MKKLMFEAGSLKVYSKDSSIPGGQYSFYWVDARSFTEQGPFDSVYAAMKNYEKIVKTEKTAKIIPVDFVERKRMSYEN